MFPRLIRTPTLGLIFEENNAYYTRKITVRELHVDKAHFGGNALYAHERWNFWEFGQKHSF